MWFVMQERLFRYFHSGTSVAWIKLDSHIPTVFVPIQCFVVGFGDHSRAVGVSPILLGYVCKRNDLDYRFLGKHILHCDVGGRNIP